MESLIIDLQDEPLVRFGGGGTQMKKFGVLVVLLRDIHVNHGFWSGVEC